MIIYNAAEFTAIHKTFKIFERFQNFKYFYVTEMNLDRCDIFENGAIKKNIYYFLAFVRDN